MPTRDPHHFAFMRTAIGKWAVLNDESWERFAGIFAEEDCEQGAHLVLPGAPLQKLYFVMRGMLRFYYLDAEGREWNKSFVEEGSFAGALSSYLLALPAPFGIQALEPTRVVAAPWARVEALYDLDPAIERLGRRFAEWLAVRKELRERAFLELDATQRYRAFVAEHPRLEQRLPAYHVASYLGVTEVALSRIKHKSPATRP